MASIFADLEKMVEQNNTVDIITVVEGPQPDQIGKIILVAGNGQVRSEVDGAVTSLVGEKVNDNAWRKPVMIEVDSEATGSYRLFWDRLATKYQALVLGGGHISQPLTEVLSLIGFDVKVFDDRPEFANTERFPAASAVVCDNFAKVLDHFSIDANTAVIIVTRGHRYDLDCLRLTVNSEARYLGMIGSKRRVKGVMEILAGEGAPAEKLHRVKTPIGFDIKAETPAEIAISIVAELIAVYRGGSGVPLSSIKGVK